MEDDVPRSLALYLSSFAVSGRGHDLRQVSHEGTQIVIIPMRFDSNKHDVLGLEYSRVGMATGRSENIEYYRVCHKASIFALRSSYHDLSSVIARSVDILEHKHTVPVSQQLPKGQGLIGRQHLTFSKSDHPGLLSMHICRDGLLSDPSPRGVERVDWKLLIHWHWWVKAPLARGFGSFDPQDEYEDTEETSLRMSCHFDARSKAAVLTSPSTETLVTPRAPRAACDAAVCYICTWPQVFCHLQCSFPPRLSTAR